MADVPVKAATNESLSVSRRFMVIAECCSRMKHLTYFENGSINVRSVAGSNRLCIVTGSTVTITSKVGDTYAARTWPARVVPSAPQPPYAYATPVFHDRARYHHSSR